MNDLNNEEADVSRGRGSYDPFKNFDRLCRWIMGNGQISGPSPCPKKPGFVLLGWVVEDDGSCLCLYRNEANNGLLIETCPPATP